VEDTKRKSYGQEKILHLPILNYKWGEPDEITVGISIWHYHIYRAGITIVEGGYPSSYESEEEIDKAIKEGKKSVQFTCKPQDLISFAKRLIDICEEKTGQNS